MNGTPPTDRALASARTLERGELTELPMSGLYEYVVVYSDGTTIDANPNDTSRGLPAIHGAPLRMGIPGFTGTPAAGTHLVVSFLDQNPSKPFVVGAFGATNATTVSYNQGQLPVARQSDSVIVYFPPAIPFTAMAVISGVPTSLAGVMTPAQPATGSIQTGNPLLTA